MNLLVSSFNQKFLYIDYIDVSSVRDVMTIMENTLKKPVSISHTRCVVLTVYQRTPTMH